MALQHLLGSNTGREACLKVTLALTLALTLAPTLAQTLALTLALTLATVQEIAPQENGLPSTPTAVLQAAWPLLAMWPVLYLFYQGELALGLDV